MIDSHCHLDCPPLFDNLDQVIKRALSNNVRYLLTISTNLSSFEKIKEIVDKHDNVFGTLGIHPHESKNYPDISANLLINLQGENKKIIGIGETGLDFYYKNSETKVQKISFIEHIRASSDLKIPLIVHTRNAEKETFDILKSEIKNSNLKVLIHCFTGSKDFAHQLIDLGCFISLSGIITFNNTKDLTKTIASLPIDRLLLETDSPYLSPVPFRSKTNEPSYIKYTAKKLSEIKNITLNEIIEETTKNFFKIFKLT